MSGLRSALGAPVVACVVLTLAACGGGAENAAGAAPTSVRVGALLLTVPGRFGRHETRRRDRLVGVVVTDYSVKAHGPALAEGVFPADGVALLLGRWVGAPVAAPRLRLPLGLDQLRGPQHRAAGTAWNGVLRFRGSLYTISFWAGRKAPPQDRAALRHALASMHGAP